MSHDVKKKQISTLEYSGIRASIMFFERIFRIHEIIIFEDYFFLHDIPLFPPLYTRVRNTKTFSLTLSINTFTLNSVNTLGLLLFDAL